MKHFQHSMNGLKDKFEQEARHFSCHLNRVNFPEFYPTQNITCDQICSKYLSCFYLGHYLLYSELGISSFLPFPAQNQEKKFIELLIVYFF